MPPAVSTGQRSCESESRGKASPQRPRKSDNKSIFSAGGALSRKKRDGRRFFHRSLISLSAGTPVPSGARPQGAQLLLGRGVARAAAQRGTERLGGGRAV